MAHKDAKFEKGMDKASRAEFEAKDEKRDAALAKDIKAKAKKKKAAKKAPAKKAAAKKKADKK